MSQLESCPFPCYSILRAFEKGSLREAHNVGDLPSEFTNRCILGVQQCQFCRKWFLKLGQHQPQCKQRQRTSIPIPHRSISPPYRRPFEYHQSRLFSRLSCRLLFRICSHHLQWLMNLYTGVLLPGQQSQTLLQTRILWLQNNSETKHLINVSLCWSPISINAMLQS